MDFSDVKGLSLRVAALIFMDRYLREEACTDEDIFERWLIEGVPDGSATNPDDIDIDMLESIAIDDESYDETCHLFKSILRQC